MKTNSRFTILLPLIISLSLIAGIFLAEIFQKNAAKQQIFVKPSKDKLSIIIDYVVSEYVDSVSRSELVEKVIPQFLENLDPHSMYFGPEEAKKVEEELEGNFGGIGIQFNIFRDTVLVVNVIKDGPSEKVGLKPGDRIVYVNDTLIASVKITNDEVMKKLRGEIGTYVNLKIKRRGVKDFINVKIKRGEIPLTSVDAFYLINSKTGYVKISSFSRNTHSQFIEAVFALRKKGISWLIVDLRNNSGGYLNAATDIIDEFFEAGKLLVYTQGRVRGRKNIMSTAKRNACVGLNVIVLIDDFSASASEIVAGAIQDHDRGFIIGRRSFGKGLVQESSTFDDGSIVRLTTARYYTPSGRCIQKPYDKGLDDYYSEVYKRFLHGEFTEKDSIVLNDSLLYYTVSGRPVYGGGGIMPDVFVPMDTSGFTKLYSEISKKNLEYLFAVEYVDNNRKNLEKIESVPLLIVHLNNDNVKSKFWNFVSKNGVKINSADLAKSGREIERTVYAFIARQVLGDSAFYQIYQESDPVINKAVEIITSGKKLEDL
ncbi:MAG TPA: S41 family peptidase [Bacteroidales bacterium]|nr:S41 family peptidase [Bacteroidales bacterium]HOL98319.1 S41 family peptidase [Bacteroidales bacterium]HOM35743.1 S41 family peptidase [Bacteroidales bacterium]HPD23117.1 S41 family peptidase [Bacteroidales bacterium]HRS99046.1 S41 family peptidase [Bacteroidales bacterium]